MTDTILESKVITGSYSPTDNGPRRLESFQPAADELWFVDKIVVSTENRGDESGTVTGIGVMRNTHTPDWYNFRESPNTATGTVTPTDNIYLGNGTLDEFMESDDILHIYQHGNWGYSYTIDYVVTLRRIL